MTSADPRPGLAPAVPASTSRDPGAEAVAPSGARTPRTAALVLNPRSGTLARLEDPVGALRQAMAAAGMVLVAEPRPDLLPDAQCRLALDADPDVVVIAGGDGTIASCVRLLLGARAVVALLPGGTMNRVTARLGLPPDPIAALAALAHGRLDALDVAEMNGRIFLYQAIVGDPARLNRFREMQRRDRGWWPLAVAAWRSLRRRPGRRIRAAIRRPRQRLKAHTFVITLPEATGPGLEIKGVRHRGAWIRIRQAFAWIRGRLGQDPSVKRVEADGVALTRPTPGSLRVSLDGEGMILPQPLRIRLHRGALKVLRP